MSRINIKCLKFIVLALTWATGFQVVSVQAQTTISVPADFPTIQAAIDASANGDTILVAAGTYQETISFLGKAIHVTSEDGPETTFLDGNQSGSVVRFFNDEGADSIIEGFTIMNGTGTFISGPDIVVGGGVFVANASPSIIGNVITNNTSSTGHGGGIGCFQAVASVTDNTVTGNEGGGVYAANSRQTMVIANNSIDTNSSNEGIDVASVAVVLIEGNTVFGNGDDGMDVRTADSVTVRGNMVTMNDGDGIRLCTCDVVEVLDNTVLAGAGDGIFSRFCEEVTAIGNYIEGRNVGGANGLYIWLADFAVSEQNICGNNMDRGHYYRDTDMVICRNNISVENGTSGLTIRGSSTFVDGFTAYGNAQGGMTSISNDFLQIRNSIFRNNGPEEIDQFLGGVDPTPEYCNIEGGFPGVGNIDVDPMFVNENGPDNNPQTIADNDYRLQAGSLCIDAGDSTTWVCTDVDFDGTPRLTDGFLDGLERVDMGAYEFSNVHLNIVGDGVPGGNITVETTGTAGLDVEIIVGYQPFLDCGQMGPTFTDLATATTFGPFTSPLNVQIQLPTIPAGFGEYIIQAVAVSDSGAMIGNTSNVVIIPVEMAETEIVSVQTLDTFRGVNIGGDVNSIADSDDSYASYHPGFTLGEASKHPIWLILDGTQAGGQTPTGISFSFEASANTLNLNYQIELFNFQINNFEVIDVGAVTLNNDTTFVVSPGGDISRFLESGSVRARVGFRPNGGFLLLLPYTVNLDQAFWQLDY